MDFLDVVEFVEVIVGEEVFGDEDVSVVNTFYLAVHVYI